MKGTLLALTGFAGLALVLGTLGVAALGPEILGPARDAIEAMPDDARDMSGIDAVLDGVEDTLSEVLPPDIEIPDEVPGELPEELPEEVPEGAEIPVELPEETEIPDELPAEADIGIDAVDSALELVPIETPL